MHVLELQRLERVLVLLGAGLGPGAISLARSQGMALRELVPPLAELLRREPVALVREQLLHEFVPRVARREGVAGLAVAALLLRRRLGHEGA